jgi:hypothetical protein
VPKKHIQFEGGYTFSNDFEIMDHTIGELLIRWGIISWAELRFGINSIVATMTANETSWSREDMSVGIKVQISRSPSTGSIVPNFAVIGAIVFPNGSGMYHEPLMQTEGKLCAAWEILEWLSFGINAGYANASTDRERYHAITCSAVLGFTLTQRLGCYAEYFGLYPESAGEKNAHYADAGINYQILPDHLQLDMRTGLRLDEREYFFGVGFIGRIAM